MLKEAPRVNQSPPAGGDVNGNSLYKVAIWDAFFATPVGSELLHSIVREILLPSPQDIPAIIQQTFSLIHAPSAQYTDEDHRARVSSCLLWLDELFARPSVSELRIANLHKQQAFEPPKVCIVM